MTAEEDKDWTSRARVVSERLFPERQFYYRSRGVVRYLSLGKRTQVLLTILFLAVVGWTGFATVYLVFKDQIIAAKNTRINEMELAYEQLSDTLHATQLHFMKLTAELEAKHKQLVDLVSLKSHLVKELGEATRELDSVSRQRDQTLAIKRTLSQRVANLEDTLSVTVDNNDQLDTSLRRAVDQVTALTRQRDTARRTRDTVIAEVENLNGRLAGLKTSQQNLVERIQERTEISLGEMETMIEITGLDVDNLLKITGKIQPQGVGGPLLTLATPHRDGPNLGDRFESSVFRLEQHLGRWEGLQDVLRRLPLSTPVDNYYLSSGFGKRRDPFTKRWAMHAGLDFAGVFRTPVYATAAGRVTFTGRRGPYGRTIEIDHGMGIKSRYGHLHRIIVKRGQSIEFRQKIGLMGSTGRSTGSHVHYEILSDGKPQDPAKFLKAGKYVFKD